MDIKTCYAMFDSDYDGVMSRLLSETRVKKFAVRFLNDKAYEELTNSLAAKDDDTSFRMAHTLKGVAANLGFSGLQKAADTLTEALRPGNVRPSDDEITNMYNDVTDAYNKTVEAIKMLEA